MVDIIAVAVVAQFLPAGVDQIAVNVIRITVRYGNALDGRAVVSSVVDRGAGDRDLGAVLTVYIDERLTGIGTEAVLVTGERTVERIRIRSSTPLVDNSVKTLEIEGDGVALVDRIVDRGDLQIARCDILLSQRAFNQ